MVSLITKDLKDKYPGKYQRKTKGRTKRRV